MLSIILHFLAYTIFLYILIIFVLTRIFIPHLNLRIKIPKKLPTGMQEKINAIKNKSNNPKEFLENAYKFLTQKYCGKKRELWKALSCLWQDLDRAWGKKGFLVCHLQNHIFGIFLIKSGFFTKKDIKKVHIFYGFNIHQYLKIKINNQWVPVDIWSASYGLKIGDKPKMF